MARPHFLTVAGAAQAFHLFPVSPVGINLFGQVGTADEESIAADRRMGGRGTQVILGITLNHIPYYLTKRCFS
jgi:hypothetical protein